MYVAKTIKIKLKITYLNFFFSFFEYKAFKKYKIDKLKKINAILSFKAQMAVDLK